MPGPSGEGRLNSSGRAPRGHFMRRSQQNEGVCRSQLHQDLPTDPIIIFRVLFLPYQWPSFKDDVLVVGFSHAWRGILGALPALAANAQLPHVCGASYNCALVAGGPGLSHLMLLCFPLRAALDMAPCHLGLTLFGAALPPTNSAFGLAPHHGSLYLVPSLVPSFCLAPLGVSHFLLLSWHQRCVSGALGCLWGEEPQGVSRT